MKGPISIVWKHRAGALFILLVIVIVIYLITPFTLEGFNENADERAGRRCGVGLPRCQGELRCINGFCASDRAPRMPILSDLPLAP